MDTFCYFFNGRFFSLSTLLLFYQMPVSGFLLVQRALYSHSRLLLMSPDHTVLDGNKQLVNVMTTRAMDMMFFFNTNSRGKMEWTKKTIAVWLYLTTGYHTRQKFVIYFQCLLPSQGNECALVKRTSAWVCFHFSRQIQTEGVLVQCSPSY